jgi:tripartite-type tricarboxylate transporter receptor subunit TctC
MSIPSGVASLISLRPHHRDRVSLGRRRAQAIKQITGRFDRRTRCAVALLGGLAVATPMGAKSQPQIWPQRTVKFIVPFGPGSATDIDARLFADRLSARWGKSVVIDNRPGGDGLVAIGSFVSANDDHTLLFASAGTFTVHPYEHEKLPYDAQRDLLPIASIAAVVLAISVPDNINARSLTELAALARANPGKLNAAAAQGLSDFLLSGFLATSGTQMARIPYRDILQAPNDLAEGRIQVLMTSLAVVLPLMQTGRIRVLAITSRTRAPVAPQVPTATEAGYSAMTLEGLNGLFGPRGMVDELRERIAADVFAVAADPVIPARLASVGQIMELGGPAEFAAGIDEQRATLAGIAKSLGRKPTR